MEVFAVSTNISRRGLTHGEPLARFEAGQLYLPREAPWLGDCLHEILSFPNTRHDDQIDSISQFLKWAEGKSDMTFVMVGTGVKIFVGGKEYGYTPGDDVV
jgi:hypothetical protein